MANKSTADRIEARDDDRADDGYATRKLLVDDCKDDDDEYADDASYLLVIVYVFPDTESPEFSCPSTSPFEAMVGRVSVFNISDAYACR